MVIQTEPRRGRHTFIVNAFEQALETEFEADDFEVAASGVYITMDGEDGAEVVAFVSHPCLIRRDDDGAHAAKREGGEA